MLNREKQEIKRMLIKELEKKRKATKTRRDSYPSFKQTTH